MREKREHIRAPYQVDVQVSGDWIGTVTSRDLSVGGMFLLTPDGMSSPAMGAELELRFAAPGNPELRIPGIVRWLSADGFGVQFGLLGVRETNAIGKVTRGKL